MCQQFHYRNNLLHASTTHGHQQVPALSGGLANCALGPGQLCFSGTVLVSTLDLSSLGTAPAPVGSGDDLAVCGALLKARLTTKGLQFDRKHALESPFKVAFEQPTGSSRSACSSNSRTSS